MGIIYSITEAMERLDYLIQLTEEWNANSQLGEGICAIGLKPKEIEVLGDIEQYAKLLCQKLKSHESVMGGKELYFMYRNYKIYQYALDE